MDAPAFKPVVFSPFGTGFIMYLSQDVSYRASVIDENLELLWHPHQPTIVGVKLLNLRQKIGNVSTECAKKTSFRQVLRHLLTLNGAVSHYHLLREIYLFAEEVVGDAEIPRDIWQEAVLGIPRPS